VYNKGREQAPKVDRANKKAEVIALLKRRRVLICSTALPFRTPRWFYAKLGQSENSVTNVTADRAFDRVTELVKKGRPCKSATFSRSPPSWHRFSACL
jgi:hypothetical protein